MATEAWTVGRLGTDDKHVEVDWELAAALTNIMEGAARSTVLKVTHMEPSRGFVDWRARVDGYAPQSSSDSVMARQSTHLRHLKDARTQRNCGGYAHSLAIENGREGASTRSH